MILQASLQALLSGNKNKVRPYSLSLEKTPYVKHTWKKLCYFLSRNDIVPSQCQGRYFYKFYSLLWSGSKLINCLKFKTFVLNKKFFK